MKNLLCLFFFTSLQACAIDNLPQELSVVADNHDCISIVEFLDRPGMVGPSYIYGYLGGNKEDSAVFWCRSKIDEYDYKLIIYSKSDVYFDCSDEIKTQNYPGGLSLLKSEEMSLNDFRYLTNGDFVSDAGVINNGDFIVSYYDGVENIFHCYNQSWIVRYRH